MDARPDIDDGEFGAWLEANPGADNRQEFKYCDLMTAMPDEDSDEVFRLSLRYDLPLDMYKPPEDLQFPGAVGFELIVALASRFVSRIAERADLSPQQRQELDAVQAALAGLPRTRPGGEYGAALRYRPPASGDGLPRHYFSLELAPDRLDLVAGEFDEMNDHNRTYSFELAADGQYEESGSLGFWVEGIEQTGDPSYEVDVSVELPDAPAPVAVPAMPAAPVPEDEERLRPPPPPVMTWEEIEDGKAGQLNFPALTPVPTVAERAFLVLAREWLAEYEAQTEAKRLTGHMGDLALACLCLSIEWGRAFTSVASEAAEKNRQTGELHYAKYLSPSIVMWWNVGSSWPCDIVWRLCQAAHSHDPHEVAAVRDLLTNLDHHFSQVRLWAMEIAWFALPWLDLVEAPRRLLKNLADTLVGPFKAAGVAARFFDTPEGFIDFAKTFKPPEGFEEQYQDRLKYVEKHGILELQAPFWETEAICRKEIERAALGFRMRKKIGRTA